MKQNKAILVTVSALSLGAFYTGVAHAQIVLNCSTQRFRVGEHSACSVGSLVINPDGSTNLSGCLVTTVPPEPGQCILETGGVPPTRNVVVEFTQNTIFLAGPGPQVKVNNLRMQPVGVATPAAQFTFTPLEVANTITLNIGGTMHFADGQALGSYSGQILVRADLQ
jgi:hypothetical protein